MTRRTMADAPEFDLRPVGAGGHFRLDGHFGFDTASAILARGNAEFARHPHVELDLSGVTTADSAGLAVLLAWLERARCRGGTMRFTGLPRQIGAIAAISDVAPLLRGAESPAVGPPGA
ncbi:MAG: lipid asymmetry maintenance protein MlaB [Pseudomonadota bacterium]